MNSVMLRPDLKTAGGEVCDVVYKNRFVGTLTMVYRESSRVAGSLQLEQEVLSKSDKELVFEAVHEYVQSFVDAIGAKDCEIMVTYSSYDHVIATEQTKAFHNDSFGVTTGANEDFEYDTDWVDTDSRLEDESPLERDDYSMGDYELVVAGEAEDAVEYQIYDKEENLLAEAFLTMEGRDVFGTVDWLVEPSDRELDVIADLIVLDLDEDEIDTFVIHMVYDNDIIETIELTHEDLLDNEDESVQVFSESELTKHDYMISMCRDDGDVLTYEIYQASRGSLPIGIATIDISQRQLTGFIDFREPGEESDRELIATLLMEELDKEKDYETLNLSMMHRNRLIEEVLFETEQVH
ncbi:hypothetical protein [Paenibacillus sp. YYML68]|uniref:hypothetical protein n=1 Tax=Paenibacillus sp. YYML68 TaxID=2909250 RepID=UPI0024925076|nr:hypothetical protein [Paenibacillus sp. YYML68]